jgi:hypothetical protein
MRLGIQLIYVLSTVHTLSSVYEKGGRHEAIKKVGERT